MFTSVMPFTQIYPGLSSHHTELCGLKKWTFIMISLMLRYQVSHKIQIFQIFQIFYAEMSDEQLSRPTQHCSPSTLCLLCALLDQFNASGRAVVLLLTIILFLKYYQFRRTSCQNDLHKLPTSGSLEKGSKFNSKYKICR